MSQVEKVSVAILSWNGRQHLEVCLPALKAQESPGVEWEIVVFDNGSTDGTLDWLRREHPQVRCLKSPANLGFCGGNNRIFEEVDGDAVALLNNDTRPRRDWLKHLVAALKEAPRDVAAVGGLIVDWEGERLDFGRGLMTFDGHAFQLDFRKPLESARIPAEGEEIPFACGGNMLIRRESFRAAGGFDESYFAYLEDVDLGWRLWSGGERVLAAPEAVVHHRSSATSDLLGLYNRGFLFERNAFLTAYKNYDEELWPKILPVVELTLLSRLQTMLEEHNPGGGLLALDPYDGHIAATQARGSTAPATAAPVEIHASRRQRWRRYGLRELAGRGLLKLTKKIWPQAPSLIPPCITDPRTVAQLRAHSFLLKNLDEAAEKRKNIQARRRRCDREIFERFPVYRVPTYPGDEKLFQSTGFRSWWPEDLPSIECDLADLMEMG